MPATEIVHIQPAVSVVIPARNEEACLGSCLQSLATQTGLTFEIILVDDHSTDRTREIASAFPQVRVIDAPPLPPGWTGKNNAVAAGACTAHAPWLLFTDADTVHLPGSLQRSLAEAERRGASLLSYSPEQIVKTFWEKAIMPVIFAELAASYRPSQVSNPKSPAAAANGQYILITREAYNAVGGHAAIAANLLEDVVLARAVKRSGRKIFFRYGPDAVRARMYRNFSQLREGWTKNLALLFPNPGRLALKTLLLWLIWASLWMVAVFANIGRAWWNVADVAVFVLLAVRLRRSNFKWDRTVLGAIFGMPMFAYLLLRSRRAHAQGNVSWKGRSYGGCPKEGNKEPPVTNSMKRTSLTPGKLA